MRYDASSIKSLRGMSDRIHALSEYTVTKLLASVIATGLMTHQCTDALIRRLTEYGVTDVDMLTTALFFGLVCASDVSGDEVIYGMRSDLVNHLLYGQDETPGSTAAGGFNQAEVDILAELIEQAENV